MKIQAILSVLWDVEVRIYDAEAKALKAKHRVTEILFFDKLGSFGGQLALLIGSGLLGGLVAKGIAAACAGLVNRTVIAAIPAVKAPGQMTSLVIESSLTTSQLAVYERYGQVASAVIFAAPDIARGNWLEALYSLAGSRLKGGKGIMPNLLGAFVSPDEFWTDVFASRPEMLELATSMQQLADLGNAELVATARIACDAMVQGVADQMPEIHAEARTKAPAVAVSMGGQLWGTQKHLDHRLQNWAGHVAEVAVWQNTLRALREFYNVVQQQLLMTLPSMKAAAARKGRIRI